MDTTRLMLSSSDLNALLLTVQLATVSTALLLVLGTPLAWWLARSQARLKFVIESLVALPLVLPPTVLGFYLLLAMSPQGPVGGVIKGWQEVLQMMPTGSKWRVHIPSHLAYGTRGAGANIPPNSTLIFEIELISIDN